MEREQDRYRRLVKVIDRAASVDHNLRHQHPDKTIVQTLLWAVVHDRPISWACDAANWPGKLRPHGLPSQSCVSRRLRTLSIQQLLERAFAFMRDQFPSGLIKYIDAKPLPVGGCSKDAEALYGRAASCKAKGYKLFAIVDRASGVIDHWVLGPMNWAEQKAADVLLAKVTGPALVVGDGEYDVSRLHDLAAARECGLLTPAPPKGAGRGNHYQSPHRLSALAAAQSAVGTALLGSRIGIEQCFGNLTSFAGGLGPLPAWVRRPHRVMVWVAAKILINFDRQLQLAKKRGVMINAA